MYHCPTDHKITHEPTSRTNSPRLSCNTWCESLCYASRRTQIPGTVLARQTRTSATCLRCRRVMYTYHGRDCMRNSRTAAAMHHTPRPVRVVSVCKAVDVTRCPVFTVNTVGSSAGPSLTSTCVPGHCVIPPHEWGSRILICATCPLQGVHPVFALVSPEPLLVHRNQPNEPAVRYRSIHVMDGQRLEASLHRHVWSQLVACAFHRLRVIWHALRTLVALSTRGCERVAAPALCTQLTAVPLACVVSVATRVRYV
jgi:hypothetical protein